MFGHILLFKATNAGWSKPAYIAALNKEDAKRVAYTLPFDQTVITIEDASIKDVPLGSFVNTDVLNREDSKIVASLFNQMAGQSISDRRRQNGFDINRPE